MQVTLGCKNKTMSTPLVIDQVDPDDSLFSQQFGDNSTSNEQIPWWQK